MKQLKPKIEDIRNKKKYGYEINVIKFCCISVWLFSMYSYHDFVGGYNCICF